MLPLLLLLGLAGLEVPSHGGDRPHVFALQASESGCPPICTCTRISNTSVIASPSEGWFVECAHRGLVGVGSGGSGFLAASALPHPTLRLVLKGNRLTTLPPNALQGLPKLIHLDLSSNRLSHIAKDAFRQLPRLQSLDLGWNELETLDASALGGLKALRSLDLSGNPLPSIPAFSLRPLTALKRLSIATAQLTCDCTARWLRRWLRKRDIALSKDSLCRFPLSLRGKVLSEVPRSQLICKSGFNPSNFSIFPTDETRLVFPGDKMVLECRLELSEWRPVRVEWSHGGRALSETGFDHIRIYNSTSSDGGGSWLLGVELGPISPLDEGLWACRAEDPEGGFATRHLKLQVMGPDLGHGEAVEPLQHSHPVLPSASQAPLVSPVCPTMVESTRWGSFSWLPSPPNASAVFACPHPRKGSGGLARKACSSDAQWGSTAADDCELASEVSRLLESELLSTRAPGTAEEHWDLLLNLSTRLGSGSATDSSFELESLARKLCGERRDERALEVAEAALGLPESVWVLNRRQWASGLRFLDLVGSVDSRKLALRGQSDGAFCDLSLGPASSHLWGRRLEEGRLQCGGDKSPSRQVSINFGLAAAVLNDSEAILARVQLLILPNAHLFADANATWLSRTQPVGLGIQDVMASLGSAFGKPRRRRSEADISEETNATTKAPLPLPPWLHLQFPIPLLTSGLHMGIWLNETWTIVSDPACQIHRSRYDEYGDASLVRINCVDPKLLPNLMRSAMADATGGLCWLSLLQSAQELEEWEGPVPVVALFPWLYGGAGCLTICLLASALAYIACIGSIRVSLKLRHALVNSWLCLTLLCLLFILGVDEVASPHCLGISAGLHFLLTASSLWQVIIIRTVQRKLGARLNPQPKADDPGQGSRHGPLVGLYFLGYGLPLMFLAFALALKVRDLERSRRFCAPAPLGVLVGTLAIPVGVLFSISLGLTLCGFWTVRRLRDGRLGPAPDEASECLVSPPRRRTDHERLSVASTGQTSTLDSDCDSTVQLSWAAASAAVFAATVAVAAVLLAPCPAPALLLPYWDYVISGLFTALLGFQGILVFYAHVMRRPGLGRCSSDSKTPPLSAAQTPQPPMSHARNRRHHQQNVGVRTRRGDSSSLSASASAEVERLSRRSMAKAYDSARRAAEESMVAEELAVVEENPAYPHDYVNVEVAAGIGGKVSPAQNPSSLLDSSSAPSWLSEDFRQKSRGPSNFSAETVL